MNPTLKFYIDQLSPKRAEMYSKSWWVIGNAIHQQTKGSKEGYNYWQEFSKQCKKYSESTCSKKWESFKKNNYPISINTIIHYLHEDGGTTYNPNHGLTIVDENVKNFVYNVIVPKLSVKRMRNIITLRNLCSGLYHMSSGKDAKVLDNVCKRIKDPNLKNAFISIWNKTLFSAQYGLNDIIHWLNTDEEEKFSKRKEYAKKVSPLKFPLYFNENTEWLENAKKYIKS